MVIGGSAGAIEPLREIVAALPATLQAAVCVVVHLGADSRSALPTLLRRSGVLPAGFPLSGAPVATGTILVAPPGRHLLIHDGHVTLSRGARVNGSRPAIDPLFRSAAAARGPRVVSVVLSGTLDDGAAGTVVVRRTGGMTIAQDPTDADFPDMPENAIATGSVAHVVPARDIGRLVAALVEELPLAGPAAGGRRGAPDAEEPDELSVDRGLAGPATDLDPPASPYGCPACGGVLHERQDPTEYLCRLGHRYSLGALGYAQSTVVEDALWTALRTLDESSSLAERVSQRARQRGDTALAGRFEARRAAAQVRADRIRAVLLEPDEEDAERGNRGA